MARRKQSNWDYEEEDLEPLDDEEEYVEASYPDEFIDLPGDDEFKTRLWEALAEYGYSDYYKTVIRLGPSLASTLRGVYTNLGGVGDGYKLVEIYQKGYLNALAPGQRPTH